VQKLQLLLASPAWLQQLDQLDGYRGASQPGMVHSLRRTLPWWGHSRPE